MRILNVSGSDDADCSVDRNTGDLAVLVLS